MFGFRPDGRRTKNIDPIVQITPYLMPMRCDAQVMLSHSIDYETLARYIAKKGTEGEKITFMQIIIASYVRAISQHPEVNRFISNKQYYSRNSISVAFTMLKDPLDADKGETAVKIKFDPTDTLFDVRDRMISVIEANRGTETSNDMDKVASAVLGLPGLTTAIVALIKLLDRYGLCPGFFVDDVLPFHVGMYITNNASIGLHHVNHHIYNFGTCSMFFGMGTVERKVVMDAKTGPKMKRFLPIGVTVDERVCSGAHFAGFFTAMRECLNNPELLEVPPEKVVYDPGVEFHVAKPSK